MGLWKAGPQSRGLRTTLTFRWQRGELNQAIGRSRAGSDPRADKQGLPSHCLHADGWPDRRLHRRRIAAGADAEDFLAPRRLGLRQRCDPSPSRAPGIIAQSHKPFLPHLLNGGMPRAEIASKQAMFTLTQLHAELAAKFLENWNAGGKIRTAMMQVEAVMQMLQPGFSVKGLSAKRRNKSNPWFKRGTLFTAVHETLPYLWLPGHSLAEDQNQQSAGAGS